MTFMTSCVITLADYKHLRKFKVSRKVLVSSLWEQQKILLKILPY
jgi:hypothetical protein